MCFISFIPVPMPADNTSDEEQGGGGIVAYGCVRKERSFIESNKVLYFNVYYWMRVIFVHLVPCSILVVLNVILVKAMRQ